MFLLKQKHCDFMFREEGEASWPNVLCCMALSLHRAKPLTPCLLKTNVLSGWVGQYSTDRCFGGSGLYVTHCHFLRKTSFCSLAGRVRFEAIHRTIHQTHQQCELAFLQILFYLFFLGVQKFGMIVGLALIFRALGPRLFLPRLFSHRIFTHSLKRLCQDIRCSAVSCSPFCAPVA